tara:strand:+ start:1456 stop:1737 length:282 start_codon:yes stop_codon:yes gene_type:complete
MTVQEIMDRVGMDKTGFAIAYIKDGLEEMALLSESHTKTVRMDINKNQRFYSLPKEAVRILDIRCKHHKNEDGLYKSVPRSVYEPGTEDSDGI